MYTSSDHAIACYDVIINTLWISSPEKLNEVMTYFDSEQAK